MSDALTAARAYFDAGYSVIPIKPDGLKEPALAKGNEVLNRVRRALPLEIATWFRGRTGVAIIGGAISGGLAVIDVEYADVGEHYAALVEGELPGLLDRLPTVRTPGKDADGGRHLYCRTPAPVASQKLARTTPDDALRRCGEATRTCLIEVKAEKGYVLAPGCSPECHPSGRTYDHVSGPPIVQAPLLTADEVDVLLRCARALHRQAEVRRPAPVAGATLSPGDDFDRRGPDWPKIIGPHGWRLFRQVGAVRYWTRPGKDRGVSASTGHCHGGHGEELLYVFSSNAQPFDELKTYGRFRAYALIGHSGDLSAAARALARRGYGSGRRPEREPVRREPLPPPGHAAPAEEKPPSGLVTTELSTIRPRAVRWLVPGRIPLGKMVLLAGDGGHGKSRLTLDLAADLSTGRPALGQVYDPLPPCETLLVSCEDDYGDTVVPRLLSAGADLTMIRRVDGVEDGAGKPLPFCLLHYEALRIELARRPGVRLIIIDPIGAFVGRSGADDHKDSELRSLLDPLAEVAAAADVALLLVKHLNKAAGLKAVYRVGGGGAYVNAARAAYVLAPAETAPTRLLLPIKWNLGPWPSGLMIRMAGLPDADRDSILAGLTHLPEADRERLGRQLFRVEWCGETATTADDALTDVKRKGPARVESAVDWLETFLGPGPKPSEEVFAEGEAVGFGRHLLFEAKKTLGERLRAFKRSSGAWHWELVLPQLFDEVIPDVPLRPGEIS